MIDETRQDLATAYVLNTLDSGGIQAFEAQLARDPELRAFTDELLESTAALALAAPRQFPPPELREHVLSSIRAEASAISTAPAAKSPTPSTGVSLLPWVLAAGFAVTTAALWFERNSWRDEAMALQKEGVTLRERAETAKERITNLAAEVDALRKESGDLRDRDALAQVRIATLSAQVETFARGSAVILWDPVKQRGIVRLANLPRPEAGKEYQLWVIDPKYPQPVSGGMVPMQADGSARVSFKTDQPVEKADKFAISIEPLGGGSKPTGAIVLLGE